jgi:peptidoglycan/xylan/chitin deacetylase (PgdA/CDA1 family)
MKNNLSVRQSAQNAGYKDFALYFVRPFLRMLLRRLKLMTLCAANRLGVGLLLMNSRWRRERLLILCYHGISLEDEHVWNSSMYMPAGLLARRMEVLRANGCNVLPLGEAIERLYAGTLPPRSVALTFDDGGYDFYKRAYPILREYGFPVTVYLATYYSYFNRPVFDVMSPYLLWKGRDRRLEWPEILGQAGTPDQLGRGRVDAQVKAFAQAKRLSGLEKDELLAQMASRLGIGYQSLCKRRLMHLMTPAESEEVAKAGVDIQLHTHRHRVPTSRDKFLREIEDNRVHIAGISSGRSAHFCYPGGFNLPEFPKWLREAEVRSATTCEVGLASPNSEVMLLPRLVDTSTLTTTEFAGWLSGVASLLPRLSN